MAKRGLWATQLGFYLAAIGSSSGLGNLWRFPYVVGENGGGAFVLLYVLLVLIMGLPLLIGELMLGRSTGKSILMAIGSLEYKKAKPFRAIGRAALLLSLMILSYYTVISGWVLHFAIQFLFALLNIHRISEFSSLTVLLKNGFLQAGLASVHLLFCVVIVLKGVQDGLEKFIGWSMPLFGLLLLILVVRSLSLNSAGDALRFLLYPDFSKLTFSSLGQAIGHVFFTLSVGFGTMVTFGSYMSENEHIPTAGFRVTMIDTLISLIAGLLIFPIALQASSLPQTDPGLLFETLPKFLLETRGGLLFGFAFFICLYLAALGSSIGLLEVIVSNWVDRSHVNRQFASWSSGTFAFILCLIPAFSGSLFHGFKIGKLSLLESIDTLIINWVLPLIALGMALAISFGMKEKDKELYFVDSNRVESAALFPYWKVVLRWVIPILIVTGILLQIVDFF